MADLKTIIIGIVIFVSLLGLIILSANIHTHQISAENAIVEARNEFMDVVVDKGALTWQDFDRLMAKLTATGGTFDITVTVQRMFVPIQSLDLSSGCSR